MCLLVLLTVISEGVSQNDECDAETQVKMSILSVLRHNISTKSGVIMKLQASIDAKEAEAAKLKSFKTFVSEIPNETAPNIGELEKACEDAVAIDCCQVSVARVRYLLTKKAITVCCMHSYRYVH